jgi:hypothetical protein
MKSSGQRRKILPKSRLMSAESLKEMDSVAWGRQHRNCRNDLLAAERCWAGLEQFRKDRERYYRYTHGDQWSDKINVNGEWITERENIQRAGGVPLTNNLITRYVRTTVGVWLSQSKEPTCTANDHDEQGLGDTMTMALQVNLKNNMSKKLNARALEEMLVGGMPIQKVSWGWRKGRWDNWIDNVNPNYFFFDSGMSDVRTWDVNMVGEIHDLDFDEVAEKFAHSENDYAALKHIYNSNRSMDYYDYNRLGESQKRVNVSFLSPYDTNKCRVIELWTIESKPRFRCVDYLNGEIYKVELKDIAQIDAENRLRMEEGVLEGMNADDVPLIEKEWMIDRYWYCRFLAPTGDVLDEYESPYEHGEHPYVFHPYPYTNGDIHSLVSDVIDQQRYVNRLVTLNDKIIRSSAKGVLLYPMSMMPKGMSLEDVKASWSKPDTVMFYDDNASKSGAYPQQIANKMTNVGITEMLQLQIQMMDDISGVHGALQGKPGFSGQSASLYAQQTANASNSLLDLLECFSQFILDVSKKSVKNIQQFYTTRRQLSISGKRSKINYDPTMMGNVDFDLSINESAETPIARMANRDILMQLWSAGAIDVKKLLEFGDFDFTAPLLESIKADEQRVANGEIPQGVPAELREQITNAANGEGVNAARNYLR